jgi:hypothetical protein
MYPSLVNYDMDIPSHPFGQDPFKVIYSQKNFEFTFTGVSTQPWAYYTLAMYEHNWGLTDIRKSEYQIRVESDPISPFVSSTRFGNEEESVSFLQ